MGQFVGSLASLLSKVVANYEDDDGTTVLGFAPLTNDGGDGGFGGWGRELAGSRTVIVVEFVLTLVTSICNRPTLTNSERDCYCKASNDIVALLNFFVDDLSALIGSFGESLVLSYRLTSQC